MKRKIYVMVDIIIGIVIGSILCNTIQDQMIAEQNTQKELYSTLGEQYTTKALSLLEGDGSIIKSSQITYPQEGEAYAVIHNDDRAFSKDLYFGDSRNILDISIGQYMKSGIPGQGKPILLAGHNGTHFKQLRYFEEGDLVKIDTSYGSYAYRVTKMEITPASEFENQAWDILGQDQELLIMYCCYPFNVIDTKDRYFVYAEKVEGPVIMEDGTWKD